MRVGLGDDYSRLLHRRADDIDAHSQVQSAILVRQGGLDEGHIQRYSLRSDQLGKIGEEYGGIISFAPIDGVSSMVADEKGVEPKVALELLVRVWCHPKGDYVYELSVKKGFGSLFDEFKKRSDQMLGLPATCSHEYPVAGANFLEDEALQISELARPLFLDIMPEGFPII